MTTTPTIKLTLPGLDSPANITVIDENMKIIDEWAKAVLEKIKSATKTTHGIVRIGDGINVEDGVISVPLKEGLVAVGQVMMTFDSTHPATTYLGTTWQKIEDRFLMGTVGPESAGVVGGNKTVSLTSDNNGPHGHAATQASHVHSQPAHTHGMHMGSGNGGGRAYVAREIDRYDGYFTNYMDPAGGDNTGAASPTITVSTSGKGSPFSIIPPFMKVHIWRRMS